MARKKVEWCFNAPYGVYQCHTLSTLMREEIYSRCRLLAFASVIDALGRRRGETVVLHSVTMAQDAPIVGENERLPEATVKTAYLAAEEYGRAVPFTSLTRDLGKWDKTHPVQSALIGLGVGTLNGVITNALRGTHLKAVPTTKGGLPLLVPTRTLSEPRFGGAIGRWLGRFNNRPLRATRRALLDSDIEAVAAMAFERCGVVPMTLVAQPGAYRELRKSKAFVDWCVYKDVDSGRKRQDGEVGSWFTRHGQIRLIEDRLATYTGTGYEAFLIAGQEPPLALAEAVPLELRAAVPIDFGRNKQVALYGVMAVGLLNAEGDRSLPCVFHICGAPRRRKLRVILGEIRAERRAKRLYKRAVTRHIRWSHAEHLVFRFEEFAKAQLESLGDWVAAKRSAAAAERDRREI